MSTPIQAGSTDQRLRCVAVQDDWSTFKTDLQIADIQSLVVKRSGAADVTVTENALDTDPDDAHTDGNIYNAGGGEYLVSVPDAAVATGAPSVKIYGTWTDGGDSGYLIGDEYPLVGYDWQTLQYSGGANTVTITVDDDSDNLLENAEVTIWSNGTIIDRQSTDASGVATLSADDNTYTLIVAVPTGGYSSSTNGSFTVSGTTAASVELTAHVTAPSDPGYVTGYVYADNDGSTGVSGQTATLTIVKRPTTGSNATGLAVKHNRTATSDGNGKMQWLNLIPGATYSLSFGGKSVETPIATDATGEVELNTVVSDEA